MGVYVPFMELPENCLECGFTFEDMKYGSCCLFTRIVCLSVGRQDKCPLIMIPSEADIKILKNEAEALGYQLVKIEEDRK